MWSRRRLQCRCGDGGDGYCCCCCFRCRKEGGGAAEGVGARCGGCWAYGRGGAAVSVPSGVCGGCDDDDSVLRHGSSNHMYEQHAPRRVTPSNKNIYIIGDVLQDMSPLSVCSSPPCSGANTAAHPQQPPLCTVTMALPPITPLQRSFMPLQVDYENADSSSEDDANVCYDDSSSSGGEKKTGRDGVGGGSCSYET